MEVLGTLEDDKSIVTISDKTVNPDLTCTASNGECLAAFATTGDGWACDKKKECSMTVSLGGDYEVHGFSIRQRSKEPFSLVSQWGVTVGENKEQSFKLKGEQANNAMTFHISPLSSNTITFKTKTFVDSEKDLKEVGGFFAIYGHKKSQEEKKDQSEENEVTAKSTTKSNNVAYFTSSEKTDDFYCEDYPINY